ncbi:MAG: CRISPR-associated protein [Microcoleus sp. CSU_2_2]|nr:CRISPR-associated protein [Microcoleus sp. SU_5_3]NJL66257.1 CRISPR-associated protein [Microcoleus sp. SM1_3_4]NJS10339.1 CRISPR-associated protein [Microcoleus sp. CSU_2_2]
MSSERYVIVTFSPVQGFIEKSRKLRDLYGSSYILSFLSWVICQKALTLQTDSVVSPALANVTQGMPNQIILKGNFSDTDKTLIQKAFYKAWGILVDSCQKWIEEEVTGWDYQYWKRDWDLWKKHAWEFFWALGEPGESITQVRERMNQVKCQRDWTGINWQWESSSLSGADAIAYPNLGRIGNPSNYNYQAEKTEIRRFYEKLSQKQGESFIEKAGLPKFLIKSHSKEYGSSFIDPREELSIPELVKRLITHLAIVERIQVGLKKLEININSDGIAKIAEELRPDSFKDLNRLKDDGSDEEKYWTGWFLGDGDGAGKYFQQLEEQGRDREEKEIRDFSLEMREWGQDLKDNQQNYLPGKGRMVYAGGDDFLGVLYEESRQISPLECFQWFYTFKSQLWQQPQPKKISASVGFVWAGPQVPQRDVLQHCHEAEKAAKNTGRDRIAFRILFNSGNHIEWVCPWWLLDKGDELSKHIPSLTKVDENLINSYRDRDRGDNWNHFYQDVATLKSRHAFGNEQIDISLALIEIYFAKVWQEIIGDRNNWWNRYDADEIQIFTGILGDPKQFNPDYQESLEFREALNAEPKVKEAFNNWVINLAQVGFYLTDDNGNTKRP